MTDSSVSLWVQPRGPGLLGAPLRGAVGPPTRPPIPRCCTKLRCCLVLPFPAATCGPCAAPPPRPSAPPRPAGLLPRPEPRVRTAEAAGLWLRVGRRGKRWRRVPEVPRGARTPAAPCLAATADRSRAAPPRRRVREARPRRSLRPAGTEHAECGPGWNSGADNFTGRLPRRRPRGRRGAWARTSRPPLAVPVGECPNFPAARLSRGGQRGAERR